MVILVLLSAKKTLFFYFMRWWLFKEESCFSSIFQELYRLSYFYQTPEQFVLFTQTFIMGRGERPESMKGTFPKISTFHDFTVPGSWAGGEMTCGDLTTRNKMRWTADKCGIVRVWKLIWSIEFQRCTSRRPTSHFLNINLLRSDLQNIYEMSSGKTW